MKQSSSRTFASCPQRTIGLGRKTHQDQSDLKSLARRIRQSKVLLQAIDGIQRIVRQLQRDESGMAERHEELHVTEVCNPAPRLSQEGPPSHVPIPKWIPLQMYVDRHVSMVAKKSDKLRELLAVAP